MLVIHNGTTMFPDNQNPKQYRPGATITKPNGDRIGPVSDGLDIGDGWVMAVPLDADPVPDGFEDVGVAPNMVSGVPKMVRQLRAVTAEDALARRAVTVKAECERRIFDIADRNTQYTLTGLASAGAMTADEMTAWQAGMGWVVDMITTCRALIQSGADYTDDTKWPAVPAGVLELAAKY